MKKGLIAIIVALVICIAAAAVTACGKKESDSTSVSSASESITDTESTSETETESETETTSETESGSEEITPSAGLAYIVKDGNICSVSAGDCTDADVVIPSTSPEGYTVYAIAEEGV